MSQQGSFFDVAAIALGNIFNGSSSAPLSSDSESDSERGDEPQPSRSPSPVERDADGVADAAADQRLLPADDTDDADDAGSPADDAASPADEAASPADDASVINDARAVTGALDNEAAIADQQQIEDAIQRQNAREQRDNSDDDMDDDSEAENEMDDPEYATARWLTEVERAFRRERLARRDRRLQEQQ
eukprot:1172159-Rhodomonas_salina.1